MAFVVGACDVDGIPVTGQAAGNAGAHADQPLSAGTGAEAHHHLFRHRRLFQALGAAVFCGAVAHLLGGGAQGQLAQHI